MAKPLSKINKTTFLSNYNIVEVSNDINVIMKQLETFNPNKQAVMIGSKKQHTLSVDEKLDLILKRLTNVEDRLTQIVQANNLIDPTSTK